MEALSILQYTLLERVRALVTGTDAKELNYTSLYLNRSTRPLSMKRAHH